MQEYYTLRDVVRVLDLKPHVITYSISAGHLPEPPVRLGNKRVFSRLDVERMAEHFRVTPRWNSLRRGDDTHTALGLEVKGLSLKKPFSVESSDEARHEVKDGDGAVYCWTTERATALLIAGLLESAVRS